MGRGCMRGCWRRGRRGEPAPRMVNRPKAADLLWFSQRGFEAELESGHLPERGRRPLQPAGAGSAGHRRAVEPALARGDQTPPLWPAGGLRSAAERQQSAAWLLRVSNE